MIKVINVVLSIGALVAAYFLYSTIQEPITFNAEFKQRDAVVKEKLKYVRDLQLAYKDVNDEFAGSFDDLKKFVQQDSMSIVRIIGDPDELDEEGNPVPVIREIIKVPVKDTLKNKKFPLAELQDVPGVEGEDFSIETSEVTRGRITVPVFEISISYQQMLKGLNKKYIDPDGVRKIGSLYEPSYNGNWED